MSKNLLREIETQTRIAVLERNPLQKAYDDYHEMQRERDRAMVDVEALVTSNHSLLSEVGMLREQLERAENDRTRFQSISSTLLGRLLAINDCIAGAVKASIKENLEPAGPVEDGTALEQAGDEAQAIIQRFAPAPAPPEPPAPKSTPAPSVTQEWAAGIPAVNW